MSDTPETERKGGVDISGGEVKVGHDLIGHDLIETTNIYANSLTAEQLGNQDLKTYPDRMLNWLEKGLLASASDDNRRTAARTITLAVLRELDSEQKLIILRFLREISKGKGTKGSSNPDGFLFSMEGAALPRLQPKADFSRTYLSKINLPHPLDLPEINLSDSDLTGASFRYVNFAGGKGANFSRANFSGADLLCTQLILAGLSGANLSDALLLGADLSRANLAGANLSGADFRGAKLTSILLLSSAQLVPVKRLQMATMPNGNKWQGNSEGPYQVAELKPYLLGEW